MFVLEVILKYMDMMSMGPSIKIVKFIAPGLGVHVLGWGRFGHTEKVLNLRKYPSKLPYKFELKQNALLLCPQQHSGKCRASS